MVISEMFAATNGLGFTIVQFQRSFAIPEMWTGIVLIGLLGFLLNWLFLRVEARFLFWHRGARGLLGEENGQRVGGDAGADDAAAEEADPGPAPTSALPSTGRSSRPQS